MSGRVSPVGATAPWRLVVSELEVHRKWLLTLSCGHNTTRPVQSTLEPRGVYEPVRVDRPAPRKLRCAECLEVIAERLLRLDES